MKYVILPSDHQRQLSFYLAMEEFVARQGDGDDCFFMWQVEPSVIFGRNQQMEAEVNVEYCRKNGIQLYRRKSGGGCVYADRDNLMLSYITSETNVAAAFNAFVNMIILVLRKLGIEAVSTANNDIMVGGRKLCGTAFYHLPDRSILHSTLLYDTDMEHMTHAITPSKEKLEQKGIQSVRQRITLLKDHVTLTLDEVKAVFRSTLCTDEWKLKPQDMVAIEQLEKFYLDEEFITRM